jgi:hypothetical protein
VGKFAQTKCVICSQKSDNDPEEKLEIKIAQNSIDYITESAQR